MHFSYQPFDVTVVLIACTAVLAIIFRYRRGPLMSWPLIFWLFTLWFQMRFDGPFDLRILIACIASTLVVRYEFHAGKATKVLQFLEFIGFCWVIYTAFVFEFV